MKTSGGTSRGQWLAAIVALLLLVTALPSRPVAAQGSSRLFPETGKTVKGKFLTYWTTNGGLARPGLPNLRGNVGEERYRRQDLHGAIL